MEQILEKSLNKLPSDIQSIVTAAWHDYLAIVKTRYSQVPQHDDFIPSLCRVWASSDFVMHNCLRHPDMLLDLFESGDVLLEYVTGQYEKKLQMILNACRDIKQLTILLREFRRREMVRIAWRDLARWTSPQKTMADLSCLADTIINQARSFLFNSLGESYGVPTDPDNQQPMPLLIIAMGKLGAYELNFSSDVDLIYCFPKDGLLDSGYTFQQFYLKLAQQLTKLLTDITQDGFVYRVDLRLRPYGTSGTLVCSTATLIDYYQTQGREWERYALVKARVINNEGIYTPALMRAIRQFVYRNYIDYTAIESLRQLQSKINLEVKRHSLENNIKRGPGGIREIEFIAQAYKIIRGGTQFRLQERNTLKSLILLREIRGIVPEQYQELSDSYLLLRNVENKLQMFNDKQTHDLPTNTLCQARLAYAMRYINWDSFNTELTRQRHLVQHWFDRLIAQPRMTVLNKEDTEKEQLFKRLWKRLAMDDASISAISSIGFTDGPEIVRLLLELKDYIQQQKLSNSANAQLKRLLPRLVIMISATSDATNLFRRMLPLIEAIIKNSMYLVLLYENPLVLSQAVNLCAASSWVVNELASYPLLLDELLDPRTSFTPPTLEDLAQLLDEQLLCVPDSELEQQLQVIRWFKQAHVLRVAAADITGILPLMRVSDYLTDIATVVVDKVRQLVLHDMIKLYGKPTLPKNYAQYGFGVVAYGKLGGIELSYSSDLDLIFLHPELDPQVLTDGHTPITNEQFYTRLGQRLLQTLTQAHAGGFLYKVDLRLRPSGQAGLLVSSVAAFAAYQNTAAWNWEHQALVRSRPISGSGPIGKLFLRIRHDILAQTRDPEQLLDNIYNMREKMREGKQLRAEGKFDLKQGVGGLVDIEFIAQYAVLRWSSHYPSLLEYPDNVRIFERVGMESLMRMKDIHILTEAYKSYRSHLHRAALQNQSHLVDADLFVFYRIAVARIWQQIFMPSPTSHAKI